MFTVKHIGSILHRLFVIAMEDIKSGHEFSRTLRAVPPSVEKCLEHDFAKMLWDLMKDAANKIHGSIDPMCTSKIHEYDVVRLTEQTERDAFTERLWTRAKGLALESGKDAKMFLVEEDKKRAQRKDSFFSETRSATIIPEESRMILQRSFECIYTLLDKRSAHFEAQTDSHFIKPFQEKMRMCFYEFSIRTDWAEVLCPDLSIKDKITECESAIEDLEKALEEVALLKSKF